MVSEEEFEEIYSKYSKSMSKIAYGYVQSMNDVEDVLQDVFMKLLTSKKVFDDENHLNYWLIRVTTNQSIDVLRKRVRSREIISSVVTENVTDSSNEDSLRNAELREAIDKLPPKLKKIIIYSYYDSMPVEEIALALDTSTRTVYRLLRKAKGILKSELEANDERI
jgi:RNA polymerase sigma-70 factor (ECF subfamily)